MFVDVYQNKVFFKTNPQPGHRYRQLAIVEKEHFEEKDYFELRIFEGDEVQRDPQFIANCSDAEVHPQSNLRTAIVNFQRECKRTIREGWLPFTPIL